MASKFAELLSTWGTTTLIVLFGFAILIAQHFSPPPAGEPAAVFVPPWRSGGMAFAAEVGLPVIDIRLGGRLLIFATTDLPLPLSRMGPFVMPANGALGCGATNDQTGVNRT